MSSYPTQRYPSPRPVMSLEELIDFFATCGKYSTPEDFDHFETRATYAEYIVWILDEPKRRLLDRLPLDQVANVLDTMPMPSGDGRLPLDLRLDIARADINVFKEIFEPLVGNPDVIASDPKAEAKLASVCFMRWDLAGYEEPAFAEIFRHEWEYLLKSNNTAIRGSALHGLGHHIGYTNDKLAVALIDDYLRTRTDLPKEEIKYAKDARRGDVQ